MCNSLYFVCPHTSKCKWMNRKTENYVSNSFCALVWVTNSEKLLEKVFLSLLFTYSSSGCQSGSVFVFFFVSWLLFPSLCPHWEVCFYAQPSRSGVLGPSQLGKIFSFSSSPEDHCLHSLHKTGISYLFGFFFKEEKNLISVSSLFINHSFSKTLYCFLFKKDLQKLEMKTSPHFIRYSLMSCALFTCFSCIVRFPILSSYPGH